MDKKNKRNLTCNGVDCLKSWRSENHTPHYYWLNESK